MYDGADTAYYLRQGFRVIAVEAIPTMIQNASARFSRQIAAASLVCENAAISLDGRPVQLTLSGADLGSSSTLPSRVALRQPLGSITVPGITINQLFESYGLLYFVKIDIEGADRLCVLSLSVDQHPNFLSFELGDDGEELIRHAMNIGYR